MSTAGEWGERIQRFAELECRGLSPLYEHLGLSIAEDPEVLEWVAANAGPRANPTILFAAVHFLLLGGADADGLGRFFPDVQKQPAPNEDLYERFRAFWNAHHGQLGELIATRTTQTNEVARCTYLLPGFVRAARATGKPLAIVEVGAAAGLNLLFDQYAYDYGEDRTAGAPNSTVRLRTELRGAVPVVEPIPEVARRVGIDIAPIDARDADARRWLEACVWPEHADRLATLRAALEFAGNNPPEMVQGNAVDVLPGLAADQPPDAAIVVVNTNVLPYFSGDERARYGEIIAHIGAARDLVWLAVEAPPFLRAGGFQGSFQGLGTGPTALPLVMTSFVNGTREDRVLAITGPHGRWLEWRGEE